MCYLFEGRLWNAATRQNQFQWFASLDGATQILSGNKHQMFTTAGYLGHKYRGRNKEVEKVSLFPEFSKLPFYPSIYILRCFCRTQVLKHSPFICVVVKDCEVQSQLTDKLYFTAKVSVKDRGHRVNGF